MEVPELLARHPWPREYADARKLEWLWTVDVPAPPERLWPLLADLSRLNRALKLPRMTFAEVDGVRWGTARYTGFPHEWIEVPWNWVNGEWYELVRLYKRGSMRALFGIYELETIETGTRVHIYYGIVPRSRIFDLGLKWSFGGMGRAYRKLLPQIAAEAMREPEIPACLRVPPEPLVDEVARRLDKIAVELIDQGLDTNAVKSLVAWVKTADDASLERIRVIERARAWSLSEDLLLRVCLHATRAGLLELTWDVVCPHCRGVRDQTGTLGSLPTSGECAACGITFGTDSMDAVEVAFHPHSSIRPIERGVYCSAEPAHKPHIHAQRTLPAGETLSIPAPEKFGKYRVRLRAEMKGAWLEVVEGGPAEVAWKAPGLVEDGTKIAPGGALVLTNASSEPQIFVVEVAEWLELALRPGRLLSFQDFRDLFAEEYIGTDVKLAVGEQTILFTDLVGSTAMYARRGDPSAFVDVKSHFETIFAIVAKQRGAIVKTIGDAVMAAFNDPLDGVKAAKAIHDAFPPSDDPNALRLRISMNTGPCIAVRLNAAIDYFGHTVNLAAKLQAVAESWQIAFSLATLAAPKVRDWLDEQGVVLEDAEINVKGVATPVAAKRWTTASQ